DSMRRTCRRVQEREITMFAKRASYLAVYGLMCASFAGIPATSAAAFSATFDAARNLSKQIRTVPVAGRSYGSTYMDSQWGSGAPYQCMTDDGYGRHRPCDSPFKRKRAK